MLEGLSKTEEMIFEFLMESGDASYKRKLLTSDLLTTISSILGQLYMTNNPSGGSFAFNSLEDQPRFCGNIHLDWNRYKDFEADKLFEIKTPNNDLRVVQFGHFTKDKKYYFIRTANSNGHVTVQTYEEPMTASREILNTLEAINN